MPGLRSSTSTRRMPLPSSVDSRRSERSSRAVASSYSVSRAIDPEDPVVRIEVVLLPLLIESLYGQLHTASVAPRLHLVVCPFTCLRGRRSLHWPMQRGAL